MRFNFENDKTTKGRFAIKLASFCDEMLIEEHADEVMEHADELYGNPAIRFLIERYHELLRHMEEEEALHGVESKQYGWADDEWATVAQLIAEMLS